VKHKLTRKKKILRRPKSANHQEPPIAAWAYIIFAMIIGLGLAFRLVGIDHIPGINGDEAYAVVKAILTMHGTHVSLYSGSGNIPSMLQYATLILLHLWFSPSFIVLRVSGAIFGVLGVLSSYFLLRRVVCERVAMVATLLFATLPVLIAYSRIAWEAVPVPFLSLLSIYLALRKRPFLTALVFGLCVATYPTTIFLFPLLLTILFAQATRAWKQNALKKPTIFLVCAVVLMMIEVCVVQQFSRHQSPMEQLLITGIPRLISGNEWRSFGLQYLQLLSGPTIYYYIVGRLSDAQWWAHMLPAGFLLLGLLMMHIIRICTRKVGVDDGFFTLGLALSLLSFFVMAGAGNMGPHVERYVLWMVVPSCIWVAMRIYEASVALRSPRLAEIVGLTVSLLLLVSFSQYYFSAILIGNSTSHNTFLTGAVEPKEQAFAAIDRIRNTKETAVIFTEDWWLYWPIKYLSLGDNSYVVSIDRQPISESYPPDFAVSEEILSNAQVFYIAWEQGGLHQRLQNDTALQSIAVIRGYAGKTILRVFEKKDVL